MYKIEIYVIYALSFNYFLVIKNDILTPILAFQMQSSSSSSSTSTSCSSSLFDGQFDCNQSNKMLINELGHGHGQLPSPIVSNVFAINPCPICGEPSNGTFFGVSTCRACGSFFRRSVIEKRKYLCRKESNCAIAKKVGMRNSCRACRLKRCFEVGMDFSQKNSKQFPQAKKVPKNAFFATKNCFPSKSMKIALSNPSQPSATKEEEAPSAQTVSAEFVKSGNEEINMNRRNCPNSFKFMQYFRNVENGQRALVSVLEGTRKMILDNQQLHMIRHDEQSQIERGFIVLLLEHVREQFPQFNEQLSEVKIAIVKNYSFQSVILRICFSTLRFFPDQSPIKHFVLNGCCLVSKDEFDYYLSSYESGKDERKKYCFECMDSFGALVARLKSLNVSEIELSALIGIQFWNCIEHFLPLSVDQIAQRNTFFVELHAMAAQRNGNGAEISIRFGLLLMLLLDTAKLAREMLETFALTDMFFPSVHSFCCSDAVIDALLNKQ